jgi:hypothetical protein
LNELTFFTQTFERCFNLGAAAVNHHGVHAHQLQQHHVFCKIGLQGGIGHGVAAIFDDQGFAMKLTDVRQGLCQNFRFVAG